MGSRVDYFIDFTKSEKIQMNDGTIYNVSFDCEIGPSILSEWGDNPKETLKEMIESLFQGGPMCGSIGEAYGIDVCEEGVDDLDETDSD